MNRFRSDGPSPRTKNPLHVSQGKYDDAERLFEQSQALLAKAFGLEHPRVAESLVKRAASLVDQVRAVVFFQNICWVGMWICIELTAQHPAGLFQSRMEAASKKMKNMVRRPSAVPGGPGESRQSFPAKHLVDRGG